MLLSVSDTRMETERLRQGFARAHYFTYCALTNDLYQSVCRFNVDVLLVKTETFTPKVKEDIAKACTDHPNLAVLLVSDNKEHGIPCTKQHPASATFHQLTFDAIYFTPPSPNSTPFLKGNLIVHGLLFNTFKQEIRILGWRAPFFHDNDVFLMRYLAEHFPRRIDADELALHCFSFQKEVSRKTVSARIASINKKASAIISNRPIITHHKGEGYQIDF